VCYKPAALASPETLARRAEAWRTKSQTTHDPITFSVNPRAPPEGHPTSGHAKVRELQEPVLSELGKKVAGVEPW
jgi:hypothetical protein